MSKITEEKTEDCDHSLYRAALGEELFYLNFGMRASRPVREVVHELINSESTIWSLRRTISVLKTSPIRRASDGSVSVSCWTWAPMALAGFLFCLLLLLYALAIVWPDKPWLNMPLPLGMGLRFLVSALNGVGIGLVARVTIKPFFDARSLNRQLIKLKVSTNAAA